jgi:hypothetical protein
MSTPGPKRRCSVCHTWYPVHHYPKAIPKSGVTTHLTICRKCRIARNRRVCSRCGCFILARYFPTIGTLQSGKPRRSSYCMTCRRSKQRDEATQKRRREGAQKQQRKKTDDDMYHCPSCHQRLPRAAFAQNKTMKNGIQTRCRVCQAKNMQSWLGKLRQSVQAITDESEQRIVWYEAQIHRWGVIVEWLPTKPL